MEPRTPSEVQATGMFPAVDGDHAVRPAWVDEARDAVDSPGRYLAYEEDGRHVVAALDRESTRIGRSLSAEVRFDDASVSRRHALVVSETGGVVRVIDDRSLNGVYVNGRRVEDSPLADGDRIGVGRHTLWFLAADG